ncbi:tRNA (adenosine(37)-N6)-dimethylallyltransferase MiaA [Buchnera aphidicola]|nr:tRNA (adenosine(37)-N6)-dimethylallyltransferase MiaA [Buchnera aphidicola]
MTFRKSFVIFIMGPTACGKTSFAINLKKILPIEIISVDSGLIYRDMNIGTAKPTSFELLNVPHKLINIKDPTETYSVAEFFHDAKREVKNIQYRGNIPVFVGGTMLYYKVLLNGLKSSPKKSTKLRNSIINILKNKGTQYIYNFLKKKNSKLIKKVHPHDSYRLFRALELSILCKKSSLIENNMDINEKFLDNICQFALIPKNKHTLYNNIKIRLQTMLESGFEDEVKMILSKKNIHENLPSMRCVGYRQMYKYLTNKINYNQLVHEIMKATVFLAKRQMTWIRSWKSLYYLDSENKNLATDTLLTVLNKQQYI